MLFVINLILLKIAARIVKQQRNAQKQLQTELTRSKGAARFAAAEGVVQRLSEARSRHATTGVRTKGAGDFMR